MIPRPMWSLAAAVLILAALLSAATAEATPGRKTACNACHNGAPSGTVTAIPSNATPSAGASYSAAITIGLTSTGNTGHWISSGSADTPALSIASAIGSQTGWTAAMTAPASPGTYTYLVWTVRGYRGQAQSATFSITVPPTSPPTPTPPTSAPTPTPTPQPTLTPTPADSFAPVTQAAGATDGAWYNETVAIELGAVDETGGSGVATVAYTIDGGDTVTAQGATANAVIAVDTRSHEDDGLHTLAYLATDAAGNAETLKTLTVNVDTQGPTTRAPWSASVRRGRLATLRFGVADAPPTCGIESIVVRIADRKGRVVKTLKRVLRGDETRPLRFRCTLREGDYRFTVYATDGAQNPQAAAGSNWLHVK